jgi:hypothetical protein
LISATTEAVSGVLSSVMSQIQGVDAGAFAPGKKKGKGKGKAAKGPGAGYAGQVSAGQDIADFYNFAEFDALSDALENEFGGALNIAAFEAKQLADEQNKLNLAEAEYREALGKASMGLGDFIGSKLGDMGAGAAGEILAGHLGEGVESAISGNGLQVGALLGAAVGTMFGSPMIGAQVGSAMETGITSLLSSLAERVGGLAGSIDPRLSGLGGAMFGGPAGVAGFYAGILAETEGLQDALRIVRLAFDKAVHWFEPFGDALKPLAWIVYTVIDAMGEYAVVASLISGQAGPMLFEGFKMVAIASLEVATWMTRAGIVAADFAIGVMDVLESLGIDVDDEWQQDMQSLRDTRQRELADLKNAQSLIAAKEYDAAMQSVDAMLAAAGAADEFTDSLNQSTLNLPAGYRMQRNVYESSGYGQGMAAGAGPNPTTLIVNIERVEASDPEQLVDALNRASELRAGKVRGGSMFFPVWGAGG